MFCKDNCGKPSQQDLLHTLTNTHTHTHRVITPWIVAMNTAVETETSDENFVYTDKPQKTNGDPSRAVSLF